MTDNNIFNIINNINLPCEIKNFIFYKYKGLCHPAAIIINNMFNSINLIKHIHSKTDYIILYFILNNKKRKKRKINIYV